MALPEITLVGHPFAPIGMGEVLRSIFRSFRAIDIPVRVLDIYGIFTPTDDVYSDLKSALVGDFGTINIFCLNGDEIEPCLRHLNTGLPPSAMNIIYPMWELPKYPDIWAKQLQRFDEVWAGSRFIQSAIVRGVGRPVIHLPLPGETNIGRLYGRRHFGLPEDRFIFFFSFDYTSYVSRKNPLGVLRAFRMLRDNTDNRNAILLIKWKGGDANSVGCRSLSSEISACDGVISMDRLLSEDEIRSLSWCSDAFVSLHRSEGFGFGISNAMYFGKPVIATRYSGNMDYMNDSNSLPVNFSLCGVPEDAYPFWEDQSWADPDVAHAAELMLHLVTNPEQGRIIGDTASRHIRSRFSYCACGLRFISQVQSPGRFKHKI